LAQAYERAGNTELALEALGNAGRFSGGNSKVLALRGYLYAKAGQNAEAREVLNTLQKIGREHYVPPYAMALVHAGLGEADAVFERLDQALRSAGCHLIFLPIDPQWNPFGNDSRFEAIVRRCDFAGGKL
jgi:tetratricopeptide (TPR) repeat protein